MRRWFNNLSTKRIIARPLAVAIAGVTKAMRRIAHSDRDPGADGRAEYPIGGFHDRAERDRLELEHTRDHALLNAIVENVPVAILAKESSKGRYVFVNRAAEALWGISRDKVIGKTAFELFPKAVADVITAHDDEFLKHKPKASSTTHRIDTLAGDQRLVNSTKIAIVDQHGEAQYLLDVIEDVTQRAQADERIRYMAHHDILTGLANRASFVEKIEDAIARLHRRGEAFAVLMLDLDRFKEINDSLGHDAGDQLLMEIASRLKLSLRESDVVARLGGDEFAIIQVSNEDPIRHASALSERIIDLVSEPFDLNGSNVIVGASIGISLAPAHGSDASELLKRADLALYQAKADGRNCYSFFDTDLATRAHARHSLERDLRSAISNDEIDVHYQPIVEMGTEQPCAVEALARWHHPELGLILPTQFIPLAEEAGLIASIGQIVLQKACATAASWPDHIKVAVNVSPVQFKKANFLDVVMCALVDSGLAPHRLELEITETMLIERHADALPVIRQLKGLGISIALAGC
jgi:diguanylate cyclase (GGDEF)-like protein/PAS domain S-box-containing protein